MKSGSSSARYKWLQPFLRNMDSICHEWHPPTLKVDVWTSMDTEQKTVIYQCIYQIHWWSSQLVRLQQSQKSTVKGFRCFLIALSASELVKANSLQTVALTVRGCSVSSRVGWRLAININMAWEKFGFAPAAFWRHRQEVLVSLSVCRIFNIAMDFFQRTLGDGSLASLEDDVMSKEHILKSHCKLSNPAGLRKDAGESKTNKQATVLLSLQSCAVWCQAIVTAAMHALEYLASEQSLLGPLCSCTSCQFLVLFFRRSFLPSHLGLPS